MGNGFSPILVRTALTSLNAMFSTNLPNTKANYAALNTVYPSFLVYTSDMSDRHIWRKHTLRYAGWLLTSECDFNTPGVMHPYPGRNFLKWLRWLTWLQLMPPADATVTVDGVVVGLAPAEAIMRTLKTALEDVGSTDVAFHWNEGAALAVTIISASPHYSIGVTSAKEADIPGGVNDDDEDDVPSSP